MENAGSGNSWGEIWFTPWNYFIFGPIESFELQFWV